MTGAALWLVGGLVLAALEMVAPGVFLLWIGVSALLAGAAAGLALDLRGQIGVFVVSAIVLVGFAALRLRRPRAPDLVNAPTAGLIGQTCRAIAFSDGEGRVALGDGTWNARVRDGIVPARGQALTVVGLDGTTLLVVSN